MKNLSQRNKLILALALTALFITKPARAGVSDIITLLTTITSTLQNAIGGALGEIRTTTNARGQLEQQVVWPLSTISQTRNFVTQVRNQFTGVAAQIHNLSVQSATLPSPRQLESLFRSQQTTNLQGINASFTTLYEPLPQPTAATTNQRNLIDVDDAMAVDSLKTAVISDQSGQQMLNVADNLEQQTATASPGSAPLLTAQALVANIESQAFFQKMLAAALREEAGALAHSNATLKFSAQATQQLTNHMQQVLTRQ